MVCQQQQPGGEKSPAGSTSPSAHLPLPFFLIVNKSQVLPDTNDSLHAIVSVSSGNNSNVTTLVTLRTFWWINRNVESMHLLTVAY